MKKKQVGRPSKPLPIDKTEEIIQWVSEGKTLREYCRIEGNPAYTTVYLWMRKDEEFAERFARAREEGHDVISEQCMEIADERPPMDANGRIDPGYVAWQKNRIWTRTQLLAKWNPAKYGDKQTVQHEGGVVLNVVTGVSDDD